MAMKEIPSNNWDKCETQNSASDQMERPLVSVVIPTYNRASMIGASILSVINQRYESLEVVVINDCSHDNTCEKLQSLAEFDERVKTHNNQIRKGSPASRNEGVLRSAGTLILFSEDDMVLEPDCISTLVGSFETLSKDHSIGAVGPRLITLDHNSGEIIGSNEKQVVKISRLTGDVACNFGLNTIMPVEVQFLHSCSLMPRAAILEIGGFDGRLYKGSYAREETDFYFRLRKSDYKLFFEPRAIMRHHYGRVGGSILPSKFSQEYYNVRNHLMYLARFYRLWAFFMFPCFFLSRLI